MRKRSRPSKSSSYDAIWRLSFGSVSAQVVADAINAQGIEIGKADVLLDEGIRELGDYTIVIKVSGDVKANLKLKVTKKED